MLEPVLSIVERLREHARSRPGRAALTFLERGEEPTDGSTYAELDAQARAVAARLRDAGLAGRPVLLALPPDLDFVRCFLGCLYAGAYAVPAPYPLGQRALERIRTRVADARPAAAFTSADPRVAATIGAIGLGEAPLIDVAEALAAPPLADVAPPAPDTIAFIQYTSGSTSRPKGVVVTHGNLAANEAQLQEGWRHGDDLVLVSWLPLHHDMGLIASMLQALFVGGTCVSMPPHAFVQRPLRWLKAVDRYGGMTSGAPNFAFDLCARMITAEEFAALDLSRWKLAFCGSEPVRPRTMERFAAAAASAGFDPKALLPCYGMAEATVYVSGGPPGRGVESLDLSRETVACGRVFGGTRIEVLDDWGRVLREGEIGEICVCGPQVTPGFWVGETGGVHPDPGRFIELDGRRFVRTGDAGAFIGGEVYVTGRIKDVIILRGMKIHAEDVEETVTQLPPEEGVAAVAAFGTIEEDRERLIVVCELARTRRRGVDQEALRARLSGAIGVDHGVLPDDIVFVRPSAIPRSSSGKVRRASTRELYLAGQLPRVAPGAEAEPQAAAAS
ncbi:MAG TPA: fatty acyl-AMP ligase [Caulobacteraceae bacterium]|jgi:acyl-CoA synthetase (AMP-forming)/AMP-acid ligase II